MKKLLLLIALLLLTLSVPVRGEKKGLQEEPKINVGIKAVSYTHLDVYKRQLLYGLY